MSEVAAVRRLTARGKLRASNTNAADRAACNGCPTVLDSSGGEVMPSQRKLGHMMLPGSLHRLCQTWRVKGGAGGAALLMPIPAMVVNPRSG